MNPCPCGYLGRCRTACRCSPAAHRSLPAAHLRAAAGSDRHARRGAAHERPGAAQLGGRREPRRDCRCGACRAEREALARAGGARSAIALGRLSARLIAAQLQRCCALTRRAHSCCERSCRAAGAVRARSAPTAGDQPHHRRSSGQRGASRRRIWPRRSSCAGRCEGRSSSARSRISADQRHHVVDALLDESSGRSVRPPLAGMAPVLPV